MFFSVHKYSFHAQFCLSNRIEAFDHLTELTVTVPSPSVYISKIVYRFLPILDFLQQDIGEVHLTIQGTLTTAILSDIILTLQMVET